MSLFEGSFLLLDRLARTLEGLSRKDDQFDDLVIGHDDTAYVGSPTVFETVEFRTGNPADNKEPGIIGLADFSGTGEVYSPAVFIVDVVGIGSSGAYSLPASTLGAAGDIDVIAIYGGFTSTIAGIPSGYSDLGGNANSQCSVRFCWRVLTGPSTATSLSDLGETNGAVRFIIRGATSIGNYEADAGLFSTYTTKTISDNTNSRICLFFLLGYSLSGYTDSLSSAYAIEPYISRSYSGGYGLALHYSFYNGPYIGSSFSVTARQSSYEATAFCQCVLYSSADAPKKDTVLVASEAPDVATIVVENVISPLDAALSASEAPDIASFDIEIPKAAFVAASISSASTFSIAAKKGGENGMGLTLVSALSIDPRKNSSDQSSFLHTSLFEGSVRPGFISAISVFETSSISESHIILFGANRSGFAAFDLESLPSCLASKSAYSAIVEDLSTSHTVESLKNALIIPGIGLTINNAVSASKGSSAVGLLWCDPYLNPSCMKASIGSANIQSLVSIYFNYSFGAGKSSTISCLTETTATGSKTTRRQAILVIAQQISSTVFKSRLASFIEVGVSSVLTSSASARSCVFILDEDADVRTEHFKSLFSAPAIECFCSLISAGRAVTVFEYGDVLVIDLRVSLGSGILDATRKNFAFEVRRGIGADYERVVDNPSIEARRSLPEELFGSATKLDGIEIVCVREIFDEDK